MTITIAIISDNIILRFTKDIQIEATNVISNKGWGMQGSWYMIIGRMGHVMIACVYYDSCVLASISR